MKSLVVINPTGLQVFNLSELIPLIESTLGKKLHWFLDSFGGNIDEDALNIDLRNYYGWFRNEITPEILSKFDHGPYCEYHEGSVLGFEKRPNFLEFVSEKKLFNLCSVSISYDHLNTGSIWAKDERVIDELINTLVELDRYPRDEDEAGNRKELPMIPAADWVNRDAD